MRYALLLRGVNMMGKNTLVMNDLVASLTSIGIKNVAYYINSGNVFFDSRMSFDKLRLQLQQHLNDEHDLTVDFALLSAPILQEEWKSLPSFWHDECLKKEVFFFMPKFNVHEFIELLAIWPLENEQMYVGKTAIFWVGHPDSSVYRHKLIRPRLLKNLSIRNGKTFNALFDFL